MSRFCLKNDKISIEVESFGAELKSLKRNSDGREYMWSAAPAYWKRTAPILFPLVGSLNGGKYRVDGVEYEMSQHGFARDMEFTLIDSGNDRLLFTLESSKDTLAKYPYKFRLEIGYKIYDTNVSVSWRVINTDNQDIYFSIGGHPAFCSPVEGESLLFDVGGPLESSVIGKGGVLSDKLRKIDLEDSRLYMSEELFADDALIFENNQAHKVSICDKDKKVYLTCEFTAPLFGVWTPPKKHAPFVCIEPWYGRCDREGFEGDIKEREWGNKLRIKEEFNAEVIFRI